MRKRDGKTYLGAIVTFSVIQPPRSMLPIGSRIGINVFFFKWETNKYILMKLLKAIVSRKAFELNLVNFLPRSF